MEWYQVIAQWVGWLPIVVSMILLGGIGVWFFQNRLQIQKEKYDLLEHKYQDSQKQTSVALVKELAETRGQLTSEIERLHSQSSQGTQRIAEFRIAELEQELKETNSQLESQRSINANIQAILDHSDLPREGIFQSDIEMHMLNTIRTQNCIYIAVEPFYVEQKVDATRLTNNHPFTIEVVFPGMFQMYLFIYDSMNTHLGEVSNPYLGIYVKDYYVTLLHFLKYVPCDDTSIFGQEGEVRILRESSFHGISPIDPDIFYIKVPFFENWIDGEGKIWDSLIERGIQQ